MRLPSSKPRVLLCFFLIACVLAIGAAIVYRLRIKPVDTKKDETGLAATISFADKGKERSLKFRSGEPISLDVSMKNYSDESWVIDSRALQLPETFLIKNSVGRVLSSVIRITYAVVPIVPKCFEPGQQYSFRVNLVQLYPPVSDPGLGVLSLLTPDEYSVQLVLRSPIRKYSTLAKGEWPARLWPEDIKSEVLHFTVGELSDGEVKRVLAGIESLPEEQRIETVKVLGATGAGQAVLQLASLALTDTSVDVRISAIQSLTRIGDKSPVQEIERILLEDTSPNVRANAAGLLGQWQLRRSVPALIEVLSEREPANLNDAHSFVWYSAIVRALGDIGDPRAIPILTEIAEQDPTDWVRKLAAAQIKRIRGQDE